MRWKPKPYQPPPEDVWLPYFAWVPVTCEDNTQVWLEWCERKISYYREWDVTYRVKGS